MRSSIGSLGFLPVAVLAGCATISSNRDHHVPIDSVPPGATVSYQGANVGVTPCTVVMRSKCSQVTLRLAGYHDQIVEVGRSGNAAIAGNILFGGLIGAMVDVGSGAAQSISTDPCWVELTPISDPRPGTWVRPPKPNPQDEDYGWIPEGKTEPVVPEQYVHRPTRAPAAPPTDG